MMRLGVLIAEFVVIGSTVDIVVFILSMIFMFVQSLRSASV